MDILPARIPDVMSRNSELQALVESGRELNSWMLSRHICFDATIAVGSATDQCESPGRSITVYNDRSLISKQPRRCFRLAQDLLSGMKLSTTKFSTKIFFKSHFRVLKLRL